MADSTFPQTLARGESFQWTAEKKKGKKIRNDVNNFLCRVNVYDQAILEKWKFKGPFGNPPKDWHQGRQSSHSYS